MASLAGFEVISLTNQGVFIVNVHLPVSFVTVDARLQQLPVVAALCRSGVGVLDPVQKGEIAVAVGVLDRGGLVPFQDQAGASLVVRRRSSHDQVFGPLQRHI